MHTPGHSPDSICLLDERGGLLFAGDTLITGDFWAHTPDTQIEVFAATLRTLADDLAGQLSAIYPGHTLRYQAGPGLLSAAADAFEAIVGRVVAPAAGHRPAATPGDPARVR